MLLLAPRIGAEMLSEDKIAIFVSDSGSGIEPERIETIFDGHAELNDETAKVGWMPPLP